MNELNAPTDGTDHIAPLSITKTIDGREVILSPLVLKELPSVLALALPIFSSFKISGSGFMDRAKTGALTDVEMSSLLTTMAVNGDEFVGLLALCCREPIDWIGNLLPDRSAELALACLHVNADFFVKAMPFLSAMASRAQDVAAELLKSAFAGQTLSPNS